jgi:hypothetical protein
MARALSIQLQWGYDVSHLVDEVELMLKPFSGRSLSQITLMPDLKLFTASLLFTKGWVLKPLKEIWENVISIDRNEFQKIIRLLRDLSKGADWAVLIQAISNLELAFNYSRLITNEKLEKMKIEDMQADLIGLKRAAGALAVNPSNTSAKQGLDDLFENIISKLESIQHTHEFLKSIGTDEKALIDSYERTEGKDGSTHYIWKKP